MRGLRRFLVALCASFLFFVSVASAEVVTVEAEGEYAMGDGDTMENMATYKEFARKMHLKF